MRTGLFGHVWAPACVAAATQANIITPTNMRNLHSVALIGKHLEKSASAADVDVVCAMFPLPLALHRLSPS
jgi:hypothetical protein